MRLDCRENTEAPSLVVQPPHYRGSFFWTPYAYSIHEVPTGKTTLQFSSILPRWPTDQQRCFRTSPPSISFYRRRLRYGPIVPSFLIFPGFSVLFSFFSLSLWFPISSAFFSFVQFASLSHIFSTISFHSLPSFSVLFFLHFSPFFSTFTGIVHFFYLTLPQNNWTDFANSSCYTRLVWKQASVRETEREIETHLYTHQGAHLVLDKGRPATLFEGQIVQGRSSFQRSGTVEFSLLPSLTFSSLSLSLASRSDGGFACSIGTTEWKEEGMRRLRRLRFEFVCYLLPTWHRT